VGLLAGAGCITTDAPAVPLYDAGNRPGPDQVATLGGYVAWVDGRDVTKLGGAFELLPGCHIVTTPTRFGGDNTTGAISATTGALTFAVSMVAGRHYLIVLGDDLNGAPTGRVTVRLNEMDAAGEAVRAIGPANSSEEIEACRREQVAP
jgi:hypothetical protein